MGAADRIGADDSSESELAAPTDIRDVISTLESVQRTKSHRVPKTHEGSTGDDPGASRTRPVGTDEPVRGA